ncbi:MAG: hypothetical protein A2312_02920 [Candidatus Staskawiczbacteria bacterium RIFOXYB2_FULL_32_9]|uniref:Uncharacterized protein n=1 Tax=Candidatus Staskawiczbacteria bacterium RIFOXYD1_FULL_32_13 TaxID=1802234 RepID=A0A1G2JR74_9BACT|nr:MAG: hypothetical protein UR22_C0011G0033 [Parcubacteria group bacterium GW2011_GWC2_32_10]OGZ77932.1 MAG: hypothetical protein A2360_00180 [Candidatus Staskawiczbacteria bacterium RIFOXYB1_FULL_32_11]OGZ78351.1 MAG: hypothetical protein A2256_04155 [Candidatus Staskawiczbacteria bacterium RIFOXYA2_FULL_32_7]OGZ83514.1 MAG: hypothetical protein A2312_02920 [Candidatus Staskawiczbacteria bacterium RIFOXYB2_FULL_32_9]OGZ87467.1 MAG: hypothetical protein A2463_04885 [Candidatus Staskawiczbacter
MKQFIKENWFKVGMLMITIILVFVYLVRINQPATDNNETDIKISNEDLSFDINLNSLNYQLPKYDSICIPDKKYSCSKDDCKQVKAGVFVLIDYANNKFYRCDDKPCDQYLAKIEESGEFVNITPQFPNGTIIKVAKGGDYFEVVSLGLDILTSYGTCSGK